MSVKLSVIMAVFNGGNSIRRTMDSVLSQKDVDFEFIIVDDKSTDNTLQILHEFITDHRIKFYMNDTNRGVTESLIKAIEVSEGTYISRIDAGDVMEPDRLKIQLGLLDLNDEIGVVASNYKMKIIYENRNIDEYEEKIPEFHEGLKRQLPFRNPIPHPGVTFRRSVYFEVGGYNKNFRTSQDYDLWVRMINVSKFYAIQAPLTTRICDTQNSISFKKNKIQIKNGIFIRVNAIKKGLLPKFPTLIGICKALIMLILPTKMNYFLRNLKRASIK
jgi:glycosyltransferase involved in cell wall biosynthesis